MENLVRLQPMHLRKGPRLQQVVNCRSKTPRETIPCRQCPTGNRLLRLIRLDVVAALRVLHQSPLFLDLFRRHPTSSSLSLTVLWAPRGPPHYRYNFPSESRNRSPRHTTVFPA